MIDDVLKKELEKSSNSFYASEDIIDKLEEKQEQPTGKLMCQIIDDVAILEAAVLKLSKSLNKISISILTSNKNLTDIISCSFKAIKLLSGNKEILSIDCCNKNIKYKLKHLADDIYKTTFKIYDKE